MVKRKWDASMDTAEDIFYWRRLKYAVDKVFQSWISFIVEALGRERTNYGTQNPIDWSDLGRNNIN